MLKPDTLDQVDKLADEMTELFAPPEYIPGCQVIEVGDKDLYGSNNGWIEAVVGRHNQQRCRWKGQFAIAAGHFVDVLYFRSYRLFVVMSQGGEDAIVSPAASIQQETLLGLTPDEQFTNDSDDLSWTGWASYTGFVTPSSITYKNGVFRVYNSTAAYAQRNRPAATGDHIALRCQVKVFGPGAIVGVFIDDGSDYGSNGADNFARAMVHKFQTTPAWYQTLIAQYRLLGSPTTKTPVTIINAPDNWMTIGIRTSGTRWTNWNADFFLINDEDEEEVINSYQMTGFNWTPSNVGLFFYVGPHATYGDMVAKVRWYDEAVS